MRFILIALTVFMSAGSPSRAEETPTKCLAAAFPDWRPFYKTDEDGHKGVLIDYLQDVLSRSGIELVWGRIVHVNRAERDLKAGELDIILAALHTPDREADLLLSAPITTIETGLIYLAGTEPVRLSQARLVLFPSLRKNKSFSAFRDVARVKIEVPSIGRAIMLIQNGRADYILANKVAFTMAAVDQEIDIPPLALHPEHRVTSTIHMLLNPDSECAAALDDINRLLSDKPFSLPPRFVQPD